MCIPKNVAGLVASGRFRPSAQKPGGARTTPVEEAAEREPFGATTAHTTTAHELRNSSATASWPGKNFNFSPDPLTHSPDRSQSADADRVDWLSAAVAPSGPSALTALYFRSNAIGAKQ